MIADQLRETPDKPLRWVAKMLGVHHTTVGSVKSELTATGETSQLDKTEPLAMAPDHCPPITSIITPPHDAFGSVKCHAEILLFNLPKLKPHYFLPDKYLG